MAKTKKLKITVNLKSKAIEKAVDGAKDFLSKLVTPAIEEVGFLAKDKITAWRFKNQVKVLNDTKDYCRRHGISPKAIPLKTLTPLLEAVGLEDDEFLQEKWAILLGNMIDSEQNIKSNIFPFILGQISKQEFKGFESAYDDVSNRSNKVRTEVEEIKVQREKPENAKQYYALQQREKLLRDQYKRVDL